MNLARILDRAKAPAKADSAFAALQTRFAALLQAAALEETRDARGLYPPDVVEVALLAYAWRAADQGADLEAAFGGVLLGKPAPGRIAFDERYYRGNLERFRKAIREASDEEVALFLHGALAYGNPLPPLASYRTTEYQGAAYPDCGETALRNFFTIVFSRDGALDPRRIEAFGARFSAGETKGEDKGGHGRLKELGAFFTEPGCLENQGSAAAHRAWSHLVSGLNRPKDLLPITYRGGDHNLQGIGLPNMLDLIAHLLPDPLLNEPWPGTGALRHEMAARKLTRLCELVSHEERTVDWRAGGGTAITADFLDVDFRIQGERAFTWKFLPGHFVLQPREASAIDWLKDIGPRPGSPWLEAWTFKLRQLQSAGLLEPFRPYSFYCGTAREISGALRLAHFYLRLDEPALRPGIFNLLDRTLVDDEFSFSQTARLLADNPGVRSDPRYYPMSRLRGMAQATKDKALQEALLTEGPESFQVCLDHGADPNHNFNGQSCLYIALLARSKDPAIAAALLRAGADARIPGLLHQAVRGGVNPGVLRAMVEAGADPRAADHAGTTPLDLARDLKDEGVLGALEGAAKAAQVPPGQ